VGRQSVFEGENYKILINHSSRGKHSWPVRLFVPKRFIKTEYHVSGRTSIRDDGSRINKYNINLDLLSYKNHLGKIGAAGIKGHLDDGDSYVYGEMERRIINHSLADVLEGEVQVSPSKAKLSVPLNPSEKDIEYSLTNIDSPYSEDNCSPMRKRFIELSMDFVRIGLIVVNFDLGKKETAEKLLEYFAIHAKNYK
jgi:hypothetical protein